MNRSLRVFVYRNLHRDCFSVRCMATGKVIAHVQSVQVRQARFVVHQKGRERVLHEKRKNVHAGVEGVLVIDPAQMWHPRKTRVVSYDPYRGPDFVDEQGRVVREAEVVWLKRGRAHIPVEG